MKRTLSVIIPCFVMFTQLALGQQLMERYTSVPSGTEASESQNTMQNAEVSISFSNRTIYYPDNAQDNPVYVHITIANKGSETVRFKLADDRAFSFDFTVYTVKNQKLPQSDSLIKKRTANTTVYFREIALESGEEYSFSENLKDYILISQPGIYYLDLTFYPELYKSKHQSLVSNRLTLEIKPSPSAASSAVLPVEARTINILQPQEIAPDRVVEQTITARQKGLWDQFFLYMDMEQMLMRDPARSQKYRASSAMERQRMLERYKADLMQERIDSDIVSIPNSFEIEKTVYSQSEGTVSVIEWFNYPSYREKKRYTYNVRQQDGIWMIYNYTVENLGTE